MSYPVPVLCVDRVKPSGGITSPPNGANIAGYITIAATALDNDRVASVQFQIDGANVGAPVLAPPFQIVGYDTHVLSAAPHTFAAIATDRIGNVAPLTSSVATVVNAPPATGQTLLGDLIAWDGESYSSYRSGPEPSDGLSGDWWWSQTGDKTSPVYFPGNPDPTHYQMRAYLAGTRVESGSAGNVVYIDVNLGGGWIEPYANGPLVPMIYLGTINGGEPFSAKRWCSIPGMNTCFCQGIAGAYDFVLKPGYQS